MHKFPNQEKNFIPQHCCSFCLYRTGSVIAGKRPAFNDDDSYLATYIEINIFLYFFWTGYITNYFLFRGTYGPQHNSIHAWRYRLYGNFSIANIWLHLWIRLKHCSFFWKIYVISTTNLDGTQLFKTSPW